MFNNRQSRRRFHLRNLARLVQLRQSVSHQQTLSESPPPFQPQQSLLSQKALEETVSQSPPPFQPSPNQFSLQMPSPSTLPRRVSPEPKSSLVLLFSPKSKEYPQSPPPMSKPVKIHEPSPPLQSSDYSQPQPLKSPQTPAAKTPPSMVNPTEESQSQPLLPSRPIDEARFRSSPPSQSLSPSSTESGDFQPPTEAKVPPSTLNARKESQPQPHSPLPQSKSNGKSLVQSSPPLLSELSETQPPLPPPEAKIQPSMLDASKESQPQPPSPLLPSKSINKTRFQPSSLSESSESQVPLSQPDAKIPASSLSMLNATKESQPQPLPPSKSIDETQSQSPPLSQRSPSSKSTTHMPEYNQQSRSQIYSSTPSSSPLLLKATENIQSQSPMSPLSLTTPTKSLITAAPPSTPPKSPPSIHSPVKSHINPSPKPAEAKILLTTLDASKESQHKPPSPLLPSKSINETQFQPSPRSQTSPPSPSLSESSESQPEAKILKPPPSTLNATEESHPQPLPNSKSIGSQSPPPSQHISPPTISKSTPLMPEYGQQSISQIHSSPPSIPYPVKSQINPSPKSSLPNPLPSHPINTESHTSKDHNKDQNHYSGIPDTMPMKIPADNQKRGKAIWSEKQNSLPMMMIVNSNVQGINTSLSLDSSSIDHDPGVHFTNRLSSNL